MMTFPTMTQRPGAFADEEAALAVNRDAFEKGMARLNRTDALIKAQPDAVLDLEWIDRNGGRTRTVSVKQFHLIEAPHRIEMRTAGARYRSRCRFSGSTHASGANTSTPTTMGRMSCTAWPPQPLSRLRLFAGKGRVARCVSSCGR